MITFIKDIIAAINFSQDHVHASCIKKFRAPGDIVGDTDSVRIFAHYSPAFIPGLV